MWMTILGMSAVTYALRATMLVTERRFPDWLGRALAYVPIALFTALTVPGLLRPHGHVTLGPEAVAGGVAAARRLAHGGPDAARDRRRGGNISAGTAVAWVRASRAAATVPPPMLIMPRQDKKAPVSCRTSPTPSHTSIGPRKSPWPPDTRSPYRHLFVIAPALRDPAGRAPVVGLSNRAVIAVELLGAGCVTAGLFAAGRAQSNAVNVLWVIACSTIWLRSENKLRHQKGN